VPDALFPTLSVGRSVVSCAWSAGEEAAGAARVGVAAVGVKGAALFPQAAAAMAAARQTTTNERQAFTDAP
jgi:hypothetical protein